MDCKKPNCTGKYKNWDKFKFKNYTVSCRLMVCTKCENPIAYFLIPNLTEQEKSLWDKWVEDFKEMIKKDDFLVPWYE